jgi:hypothetical protein
MSVIFQPKLNAATDWLLRKAIYTTDAGENINASRRSRRAAGPDDLLANRRQKRKDGISPSEVFAPRGAEVRCGVALTHRQAMYIAPGAEAAQGKLDASAAGP